MRGRALLCLVGSLIQERRALSTAGSSKACPDIFAPGSRACGARPVLLVAISPMAIEQSTTSVPAPIGCLSMPFGGRCRTTPSFEMPAIHSVKPSSGMSVFAAMSSFAVSFPLTRARTTQAGSDGLFDRDGIRPRPRDAFSVVECADPYQE